MTRVCAKHRKNDHPKTCAVCRAYLKIRQGK